jgi:uncharacterized protein YkwD
MTRARRRILGLVTTCSALACLTSPAAGASCANADLAPTTANTASVARATECLVNVERRRHHLSRLRHSSSLSRAARTHASDMVSRGYFSHLSPSGLTPTDRARRSGYVPLGARLVLGEDLSWASEGTASARQSVARWMRSRPHRRNILARSYRHIGVGIAVGSPGPGGGGATFAVEFARRR